MREEDKTAVRAHQDPAEAPVDATRMMRSEPPPTGDPVVDPNAPKTSTQLAEKSRRERRRERDRRAEKTAQRTLIGLFLALGAGGYYLLNSGMFDATPAETPVEAVPDPNVLAAPTGPKLSSSPANEPTIPALISLKAEGLTLAAEGLPDVRAVEGAAPPAVLAGLETCRFAYGIWEFSPNRAFRFFTTCSLLEGQILVGAYEISGSKILTSALSTGDGISLLSTFEIEKPSSVHTQVRIAPRPGVELGLEVQQRITVIRAGMDGDGFYRNYAPKNTVQVQGLSAPAPKPAPGKTKSTAPAHKEKEKESDAKDPVLDLIEHAE